MPYELHITRDEREDAEPISLDEWRACVEADPEMRMVGVATAPGGGGETIRYANEGLAVWTDPSDRSEVYFDLREWAISVANPEDSAVAKMKALAGRLGADVIGDEGERY